MTSASLAHHSHRNMAAALSCRPDKSKGSGSFRAVRDACTRLGSRSMAARAVECGLTRAEPLLSTFVASVGVARLVRHGTKDVEAEIDEIVALPGPCRHRRGVQQLARFIVSVPVRWSPLA